MRLKGKNALVTGGTKGLGLALVKSLSNEGANVVTCARSISSSNKEPNVVYMEADISKEDEVSTLVKDIEESLGPVSLLINNVGYGGSLAKAWETDSDEVLKHWMTNTNAPISLIRKIIPSMLKNRDGTIVNIASQAGKRAVPGLSAYSSSKFALVGYADALAKEIEGTGVKCITICPAGMNTEVRRSLFDDAEKQQDPGVVAHLITDMICGSIPTMNGAEVIIKDGKVVSVEHSRTN